MTLQSYLTEVKERLATATPVTFFSDFSDTTDIEFYNHSRQDVEKLVRIVVELSEALDDFHFYCCTACEENMVVRDYALTHADKIAEDK